MVAGSGCTHQQNPCSGQAAGPLGTCSMSCLHLKIKKIPCELGGNTQRKKLLGVPGTKFDIVDTQRKKAAGSPRIKFDHSFSQIKPLVAAGACRSSALLWHTKLSILGGEMGSGTLRGLKVWCLEVHRVWQTPYPEFGVRFGRFGISSLRQKRLHKLQSVSKDNFGLGTKFISI